MAIEATKAGTTASVQYALQFPSGQTAKWSEFQIAEHFSLNERNLGKSLKREHRIEEVQSQQGTSLTTKVGALFQAGSIEEDASITRNKNHNSCTVERLRGPNCFGNSKPSKQRGGHLGGGDLRIG